LTQRDELLWRVVQPTPLVGWRDDEHPHVATGRLLDGRPVSLMDVVPVQVDVVEAVSGARLAIGDRVHDHVERRMRRETDEAHLPLLHETLCSLETTARSDGPVEGRSVVDAMKTQQI